MNNSETIFDLAEASKCRHNLSYGEALQRRIGRKEARINDNLSMDRVLVPMHPSIQGPPPNRVIPGIPGGIEQ